MSKTAKRKFSAEEKVGILKRHLQGQEAVSLMGSADLSCSGKFAKA
jgi:transposase-like protein